jgi:TPR repeat protein
MEFSAICYLLVETLETMTYPRKRAMFVLVFAVALSTSLAAQDASAGLDQAVLAKAKAGDASAELAIGIEYQKGDLVPRDFVQAAEWFRKASDQGNAHAQFKLGTLYQQRESGLMQDDAQADQWLRKAADQGLAEAQNALALAYLRGKGVPQDAAQAVDWFQKAVAQNDAQAMVNLAGLYSKGQGVGRDEKQAFALVNKAADLGDAEAEYQLGVDYEQGLGTKKDKGQAIGQYRKAADQGNPWAQYNLAPLLGPNRVEAWFWLTEAMDKLDGDTLLKATALRNEIESKMKPAEKAEAEQRVSNWHPTKPAAAQ